MAFTNLKISIEKSWKFTSQVLILIILGIIAIIGVLFLAWQLIKVPPTEQLPQLEEKGEKLEGVLPRSKEYVEQQPIELQLPDPKIEIEESQRSYEN